MADALAALVATLIPTLGRALLHFVWQGALIGLLAAIVLQLLRNARPQARYAVACLAMLACVLAPTLGVVLQLADNGPAATALAIPPASHIVGVVAVPAADIAAWPARFESLLPAALFSQGMLPLIVALWAGGASVLSLRMAMGVIWIRRLHATPQGSAHVAWQERLDALAQRFGLTRPVALRLVDTLDSPASAGWLRPVVLLPAALIMRMPIDMIEALLAHELAHVRRHDYLVNLLQGVVEALLFYHPVTWWLSRRIRSEREHIADQLAAGVTAAPHRLALALSELAEWRDESTSNSVLPHLAQAAHGGHLMSRIQHLIEPSRRTASGKIAFPLIGLAAACIALYAQAQVSKPEPAAVAPRSATTVPAPAVSRGPVLETHAAVAQVKHVHDDDTKKAFALVRKDVEGISMSGSTDDIEAIKAARASVDSDFIWFRRGDRAYVVVDPATVARAQNAWRDVEKLSPQMEALGKQMEVHGHKLEQLGAKMEKLSSHQRATPAMEKAAQRMAQIGVQQQAIATQQARLAVEMMDANEPQREKLQARMDTLTEQMDALIGQMDEQNEVLEAQTEQLEANQKPMEALSDQMEEASKPMEALGEQMEALGEQQEKHVRIAERELEKLIDAALEQGLAKPAPGRASNQ